MTDYYRTDALILFSEFMQIFTDNRLVNRHFIDVLIKYGNYSMYIVFIEQFSSRLMIACLFVAQAHQFLRGYIMLITS